MIPSNGYRWVETSRGALLAEFEWAGRRDIELKLNNSPRQLPAVERPESLVDFLSEVIGFSPSEANEIASSLTADWHPPNTSGSKTGIVLIDVGWHRRISEKHGFPPSEEPEVIAHWEVEDDKNPRRLSDSQGFEDVEAALAWARERAPLVLVRLGPTDDDCYSAGERLATRELGEFGGTDLTPYPEWPPAERV